MTNKSTKDLLDEVWKIFSQYIRLRDCIRSCDNIEYGQCISCDEIVPIRQAQAGHFISRQFHSLLFDERNVHLQCQNCNEFMRGNILRYTNAMVALYGEGILEELLKKKLQIKQYHAPELAEMYDLYKAKIKSLKEIYG